MAPNKKLHPTNRPLSKSFDMLNKCVYVVGPQSTGKTTLINALAERLGPSIPVIKEVARRVMQEKGYTREDVDSDDPERRFSMQKHIFTAQLEAENDLLESDKNTVFLSDRSAIDPIVYFAHYSGNAMASRITSTSEWESCRERYADKESSVIVLLLPVKKFLADDNIRYVATSEQDWYALANAFRVFIKDEGISVLEIGEECCDIQDRVEMVLDWIDVDQKDTNL